MYLLATNPEPLVVIMLSLITGGLMIYLPMQVIEAYKRKKKRKKKGY